MNDVDTDVDSDLSDDDHQGNLNHLGRNMLGATCEVQRACQNEDVNMFWRTTTKYVQWLFPSISNGIIPTILAIGLDIKTSPNCPLRNANKNNQVFIINYSDDDASPAPIKLKKLCDKTKAKTAKQLLAIDLKVSRIKQLILGGGAIFHSKHGMWSMSLLWWSNWVPTSLRVSCSFLMKC